MDLVGLSYSGPGALRVMVRLIRDLATGKRLTVVTSVVPSLFV